MAWNLRRLLKYPLSAAVSLGTTLAIAEKPELTALFPASGQAGTTVSLTAQGKFAGWPMQVWSDSPGLQITCGTEPGQLQVVIGPQVEHGRHWIRLHSTQGASGLRPFLVDGALHALEVEPNDRPAQVTQVVVTRLGESSDNVIDGVLNRRADVDLVAVTLAADQWLAATVDSAKWLESPADASLQILDEHGFVLKENLDHVGLDPYIAYQAPQAGKYLVRIFAFPASPDSTIAFSGGSDWIYRLRLDGHPEPLNSALDYAQHLELQTLASAPVASGAHTSADQALAVSLPSRVTGTIAKPQQVDHVRFQASAGQHYRFSVLARGCGSSLDAVLAVLDAQGKQLTQLDDVAQIRDPLIQWQAPADGDYVVSIGDFHKLGGDDYRYFLQLDLQNPDATANVDGDLISAIVGVEQEIVVNVQRQLDYAGELAITIEGMPGGIKSSPVSSISGSDTSAKVTLKLIASEPFQGPLTMVATSLDGLIAKPVAGPQGKPVWLSITPAE